MSAWTTAQEGQHTPYLKKPNALGVKLRLAPAATPRTPPIPPTDEAAPPAGGQVSASTTGWTDRAPIRPDQVCPATRYGGYAGGPASRLPDARRRLPRPQACSGPGWSVKSPSALPQAVARSPTADARHTMPLAGAPRRFWPQAARSPAHAAGGAPPRGMPPGPTRACPQVGQRSGWASPRWAHTVCQARGAGTRTGGWPHWSRQRASASGWVGWDSPEDRTTRVWGAGTCSSHRGRKSSLDNVIRARCAAPDVGSSALARYVQGTRSPSQATSRTFLIGPPRRDRARDVTTPAPCGSRAIMRTFHRVLGGWPRRVSRWENCWGRLASGSTRSSRAQARRRAAPLCPRHPAMPPRAGSSNPLRTACQCPSGGSPPPVTKHWRGGCRTRG
jgi:hypothetical protein